MWEIDEICKKARENRNPYKEMWKELKGRVQSLREFSKRCENEYLKQGDQDMAQTYWNWALEDYIILELMKELEEKHLSSQSFN